AGCDGNTYYFRIQLSVSDPIGLTTTVEGNLYPACNPPVPDFSANVTVGCPGQQVNFTDASTNLPDTWSWSFPGGNPATSTLQNPSVIYSTGGTYNVSLTAASTRGSNSITKTGYIVIKSKPTASITPSGTDSVCSQQAVLLSANTGTNLTYQWQKSGMDIAGATGITYNATTAGKYKVKVIRTTSGCINYSYVTKIVYRVMNAVATPQGPTTFCAGDSVKIVAGSGPSYTYQWRKNNINVSGATSISYTAKTSGVYKVKVTDAYGCTKFSAGVTVTVNNCVIMADARNAVTLNNQLKVALSPNPVHETALLSVTLSEDETITVEIFDALGKYVNSIADNVMMNKGQNEIAFDVSDFTPGIYFVKISDNKSSKILKLMVNQ
ncbi:MAG: PKD domain-containing protein, partial [Bacteroidota bacterium]